MAMKMILSVRDVASRGGARVPVTLLPFESHFFKQTTYNRWPKWRDNLVPEYSHFGTVCPPLKNSGYAGHWRFTYKEGLWKPVALLLVTLINRYQKCEVCVLVSLTHPLSLHPGWDSCTLYSVYTKSPVYRALTQIPLGQVALTFSLPWTSVCLFFWWFHWQIAHLIPCPSGKQVEILLA